MVMSLSEMANKLRTFIIDSQNDAHSSQNMNMTKYNNVKLSMDESKNYPHITIGIGISEATYNIKDIVRTEGGLGSDERYVRKWLGNFTISYDLNEIYKNFRTSLAGVSKIEEGSKNSDFSLEADVNGKIKRVYAARAANNSGRRKISREKKDQIKSDLKNYLKSSKRRFR
ncbi:MAG: hypothetical protein SPL73_06090 [Cyanobacteriota bacterium]|nr:hypothetical protein [Cyanobacteriota bacterium]MDY6358156.1 hypothetical protein [Cyanobacteriota bacterium]MDY6364442.1 hypothetical protein [Cyanobacteriota bacterium]MDY6383415.1 hypothetical protein [Cyanobacteriota bacterium]